MTNQVVRPWRTAVTVLACSLLAGACGARWSDSERAEVLNRSRSARPAAAVAQGADVPAEVTTGDTSPAGAALSDPSIGAGPSTGPSPAAGPSTLPCAAPSTAPGVAADVLTVGNMTTITGPVPGLGSTAQGAATSYVAYLNSIGGVCGRKVRLLTADDGNDGARSRQITSDFASKALGVVGYFAPSGGAAASVIEAAHLPVIGSIGDQTVRTLASVFNMNPPPRPQPAEKFAFLKAQGVRTAAVVTLSAAAAVAELDQHQAQMEAAGITIALRLILPITTLSYDSAARAVANSGADYLFFLGAEGMNAAMAKSLRASGYQLKFEEYPTGYGSKYPALAGSAAEGTSSWIRSLPAQEASSNAELARFLDWMRRTVPGTEPDVFAVDAWASSKAFFDALQQLDGPITREALVQELRTYDRYDGDGLLGQIDLANGLSNGCLIGLRLEGGEWRRMAPATGFLC